MNIDETTVEKDEVAESAAEMPEEVQDFLWSDAFNLIIRGIARTLSFSDQQATILKSCAEDLLLKTKDMSETLVVLQATGVQGDTALKALYAIDKEILGRAEALNEFYSEDESEQPEQVSPPGATTDPLFESLKLRLTQPKSIAPANQAPGKEIGDIVKKDVPSPSVKDDPYRENV